MKRRLWRALAFALLLCGLLAMPHHARAQSDDDVVDEDFSDQEIVDEDFEDIIRLDTDLKKYQGQLAKEKSRQSKLVRRLQTALQTLGFYYGKIDGDFGPGTEEALGAYQQSKGLYPTSFITEYDIDQLEADASARAGVGSAMTDTAAAALRSPAPEQQQ